ncbi:MAG: DUF2935 domain-containing protein [Bacillota bacterium]|nr:DUF2935 domain-containing protein [Bacillota bacterium]
MLSPLEELIFWTGIFRDHGEFILSSLSYNEKEAIKGASYYKEMFASLHEELKKLGGANVAYSIDTILDGFINLLVSFINFKRILLRSLLQCNLSASLPPTFYNHMINEAMDCYKTLCKIKYNMPESPLIENLNLFKVWLPDAAGHAAIIASDLDPVEKQLIEEAQGFEKCFNYQVLKSDELGKMLLRTCLDDGALKYFNQQVVNKIEEFICYLDKLWRLKVDCKVLGTLKTLTPNHMMREEKHYLATIRSIKNISL